MLDWKKFSAAVLASQGDQGKLTQVLSDYEDEFNTFNSQLSESSKSVQSLTEQVESLQKTNMNLFLKQGNPTPSPSLNEEKALTYEDLLENFN